MDIISYILIFAIIGFYIFKRPSLEITLMALIVLAITRMLSSNLKANYYEKFYKNLKDENEILMNKVRRLEEEKENISNKSNK